LQKNCWLQIGVLVLTWLRLERATIYIKKNFECSFCDGNYHEYELVHLGEGNTWIFNDEDSYVKKCKINFKKEFALVMQRAKAKFQPEMQYINVSSYLFSPGCIIYLEALCPFFAFSYFVFTSFINKHFY
jgi:hypothetical protein